MSQNNKDHSMEEIEETVVLPDEEPLKDPNEDIPFVPYKDEVKSSLLEKETNEGTISSENIGVKKIEDTEPEITEYETAIKFSTEEEKVVETYNLNDVDIAVEHEEGVLEIPSEESDLVEKEEPVAGNSEPTKDETPKKKVGFFAGLFKKRKKKNTVSEETEQEVENTEEPVVAAEETVIETSEEELGQTTTPNSDGDSETLDSEPTVIILENEDVEGSLGGPNEINESVEDVHKNPSDSYEDDIEVIDSGEPNELGQENEIVNEELANAEGTNAEEIPLVEEEIAETSVKNNGKKKKVFFVAAGFLATAIIASGALLLIKDEDGNSLFSQIIGKEEVVDSQPTIPVNNDPNQWDNNSNDGDFNSENPSGGFEEGESPEELEEIGIQDSHTEAISEALVPILKTLNGTVDSVEKYNGTIRINATIKKGDLLDINRVVRMSQIETYPYLIEDLGSTQIFITFGKNIYSFETSKTVIEFIAKLNYEDRHSAQMWWQKTRAYKNGINIKASQVKDRLYVEYLHPIFPELTQEQLNDESSVKEGDGGSKDSSKGGSEGDTSYDENNDSSNAESYANVTTKAGTAEIVYPKDIKKEIKHSSSTADGVNSNATKSDTLGSEFGFTFTEMSPDTGAEGEFTSALDKAFAFYTSEFEGSDSSLKTTRSKEDGTTFEGVKYNARTYESKTNDKHIFTTFATYSANGKVYTYVINHPKQDDYRVTYMLKGVKFLEGGGTDNTEPTEIKPSNGSTTVPTSSFIGDKATKKYYPANSEKAKSIDDKNKLIFKTEDEAKKANFEKGE